MEKRLACHSTEKGECSRSLAVDSLSFLLDGLSGDWVREAQLPDLPGTILSSLPYVTDDYPQIVHDLSIQCQSLGRSDFSLIDALSLPGALLSLQSSQAVPLAAQGLCAVHWASKLSA